MLRSASVIWLSGPGRKRLNQPSIDPILSFSPQSLGVQKAVLQLARLYPEARDRERFEERWPRFLSSEPLVKEVLWRAGADQLAFLTESLLPTETDARRPILLVVGNPAPHSVLNGLPFSFEADQREHRFWRALSQAGLLSFDLVPTQVGPIAELNEQRKAALYSLSYHSPFRIGIAVYFSMPSPAAAPPWAGVAGLRRLFGITALNVIARAEEQRLSEMIRNFNAGSGAVIAFQRDAYEGIRLQTDPPYSLRGVLDSLLQGTCKLERRIPVFCGPPTRLMQGAPARASLARISTRLTETS